MVLSAAEKAGETVEAELERQVVERLVPGVALAEPVRRITYLLEFLRDGRPAEVDVVRRYV